MLPPNRQLKKLSDIATMWPKKSLISDLNNECEISFVPMSDLSQEEKLFNVLEIKKLWDVRKWYTYFEDNDVLLAKVTPCFENGKCGIAKDLTNWIGFGSSEFIVFRSLPQTYPEYLYYFLSRKDFRNQWAQNMWWAVGLQRVKKDWLENILIPLPPLATQHAIVSALDEMSEQISASRTAVQSQLDALDAMWQSVLSEVFENEKYESVELKSLIQKTSSIKPHENPNENFTYIDISSIDKDIQKITNPNSFIWSQAPSRAKKQIQKWDIIFATTRPNLKNIALINEDFSNPVASTWFCVLRCNSKVHKRYLFYFLTTQNLQDQIEPYIRWAQYPAISDKDLLSCVLSLPDLATQTSIVSHLDQVSQHISLLKTQYLTQLQSYDELWASVLDRAFAGELVAE